MRHETHIRLRHKAYTRWLSNLRFARSNKGSGDVRILGYVRVSSEEQARDGVSLDAQTAKVQGFAALHGLELVEVVSDPAVSAKTLERPGLARVLGLLDAGAVNGLVVFKLDRLTRSLADWSLLIDRYFGEAGGRSLMSVSESIDTRTAGGRMVLNLLMTVAQWERETIAERTKAALAFKHARGERTGGVPFGRRLNPDGRTLDPDPGELAALVEIRRWRSEGWSLRRIAAELDRRGIPPKRGGPRWSHASVRHLVRRPAP